MSLYLPVNFIYANTFNIGGYLTGLFFFIHQLRLSQLIIEQTYRQYFLGMFLSKEHRSGDHTGQVETVLFDHKNKKLMIFTKNQENDTPTSISYI